MHNTHSNQLLLTRVPKLSLSNKHHIQQNIAEQQYTAEKCMYVSKQFLLQNYPVMLFL